MSYHITRWLYVFGGRGRTRTDAYGCGRTRTDADGRGRTRTDADGRGRTRTDADILFLFKKNKNNFFFFWGIHISTGPIGASPRVRPLGSPPPPQLANYMSTMHRYWDGSAQEQVTYNSIRFYRYRWIIE